MDNEFDSLLKTESPSVEDVQPQEDKLSISKQMIKRICKALCLPVCEYVPAKTVVSIQNYFENKNNKERILYSEISSFIYGLSSEKQGNFATNIDCLLTYVLDEQHSVDEDICKIAIKIYDHFQLAVHQKHLNFETNEVVRLNLTKSIAEANKAIEKSAKNAKNIEKEYITILGIFASIVLTFVGGLTFSTSILQNIDSVSIYRLLLTIDLLAIVIVNAIFLLMKFICYINDKDNKVISIKWR